MVFDHGCRLPPALLGGVLMFSLCLSSCAFYVPMCESYGLPAYTFHYEEPSGARLASRRLARSAKRLQKEFQMCLIGTGASVNDAVHFLSLSFQVAARASKEDARRLLVTCLEKFLKDINGDEELRPYLYHYPFTAADVEICLYYVSEEGKPVYHPSIRSASNTTLEATGQTVLNFATKSPDKCFGYKLLEEEAYEPCSSLSSGSH